MSLVGIYECQYGAAVYVLGRVGTGGGRGNPGWQVGWVPEGWWWWVYQGGGCTRVGSVLFLAWPGPVLALPWPYPA